MDRIDQLFPQFLRERTYVNNVTASTREWYQSAWKAFRTAQGTLISGSSRRRAGGLR
jgi:hypothetical protein